MNKQQSNQMASLRKKLLAAIAMLLVACIMTVSSTYAWFTLSTAPEVKGISTTVGANGNLEMALGTYDTFLGAVDPSSYVGSSFDKTGDYTLSNITWGNLVDLSSDSYGLQNITLYPAQLNMVDGSTSQINRTSPLQFPKYGADGRVTELSNNTLLGKHSAGVFTYDSTVNHAGVSAVGSSSSISKRAFAVKNSKAAINSYRKAAQDAVIGLISNYGDDLAVIALNQVLQDGDKAVLDTMITELNVAADNISESIKSAVQVFLASDQSGLTDEEWEIAAALADGKDIVAFLEALDVEAPAELDAYIGQYEAILADLDAAEAALAQGDDWATVSSAVSILLKTDGIMFKGTGEYTVTEVKAEVGDSMNMSGPIVKDLMAAVTGNTFKIVFKATSGIFGDIATLTGEYTTSMTFADDVNVAGIPASLLNGRPVVVESGSTIAPRGDLDAMAAASVIADAAAPTTSSSTSVTLTNTYGYMVDLLFRTNAAGSDLQLQTEGVGRIYGEDGIEDTMGSGSNITFTKTNEYTEDKIDGLAQAIRVVFMDNQGNVIAMAALDCDNGESTGNAYKMNLYLHGYTINPDGTVALGDKLDDDALCSLNANEKTAISALVYLDGALVQNDDAGIFGGLQSTVNLQFSSSVELTPMENADLMAQ